MNSVGDSSPQVPVARAQRAPSQRATVYDVAERAGVSIKTVSRVVTGAGSVSPDTRRRVEEAVAALSYVPNMAARSLRVGVGDTIGVIVDSIADPFFASLTAAIEDEALAHGMSVVIGSTGRDPLRVSDQVRRLVQQRVRGIIVAPVGRQTELADAIGGHPAVFVDRSTDVPGIDTVRVADRAAARRAVGHLLLHGHRRIAFFGDTNEVATIVERRLGYRDALRAAGIAPDPSLIFSGCGETDTAAVATADLLAGDSGATAIFASNPRAAVGITTTLHGAGRTDMALVSFGDFPLAAAVSPAVTVIDQDPFLMGAAAAGRLLARLDGDDSPAVDLRMPTPLIVRGSGELAPTTVRSANARVP
jgi:LacI family transcriptional regulator